MGTKYITNSARQTQKLGEKFAREVSVAELGETAFVVGLKGELGGGKTCFLQGFAKGLGVKEKILSPTFVILKKFEITKLKNQKSKCKMTNQNVKILKYQNFYHFDCYRIKDSKEILDLGFQEIISNPKNIIAIEWPEKIKDVLPKNTDWIEFEFINDGKREIKIKNNS